MTEPSDNKQNAIRVAAIHQPNFLPWLGFFYKWWQSDIFILYDDVQFVRRGYTNRVKIKTRQGEVWLTVPVKQKGNYFQNIGEIEIDRDVNWKRKLTGTLTAGYSRAPFFRRYFRRLEEVIANDYILLAQLNAALLSWASEELALPVPVIASSSLQDISGSSTQRLISVCRAVGAGHYLSGFGGQKYQEEELFSESGIRLKVYDFKHPEYPQLWGDFIPGLSVVDLLFNCGEKSSLIIRKSENPEE